MVWKLNGINEYYKKGRWAYELDNEKGAKEIKEYYNGKFNDSSNVREKTLKKAKAKLLKNGYKKVWETIHWDNNKPSFHSIVVTNYLTKKGYTVHLVGKLLNKKDREAKFKTKATALSYAKKLMKKYK